MNPLIYHQQFSSLIPYSAVSPEISITPPFPICIHHSFHPLIEIQKNTQMICTTRSAVYLIKNGGQLALQQRRVVGVRKRVEYVRRIAHHVQHTCTAKKKLSPSTIISLSFCWFLVGDTSSVQAVRTRRAWYFRNKATSRETQRPMTNSDVPHQPSPTPPFPPLLVFRRLASVFSKVLRLYCFQAKVSLVQGSRWSRKSTGHMSQDCVSA